MNARSFRGLLEADEVPLGVFDLHDPADGGDLALGHDDLPAVGHDRRRRGVDVGDAQRALVAGNSASGNDLVPLLQRAADGGVLPVSRVDQEKPGRSPSRELPSEDMFVEAAGACAIVGMNREVRNVIGHLEIRIRERRLANLR